MKAVNALLFPSPPPSFPFPFPTSPSPPVLFFFLFLPGCFLAQPGPMLCAVDEVARSCLGKASSGDCEDAPSTKAESVAWYPSCLSLGCWENGQQPVTLGIIQIYVPKRLWAGTPEGQSVNFGWQLLWEGSEGLWKLMEGPVCPSELGRQELQVPGEAARKPQSPFRKCRKDQPEEVSFPAALHFHPLPPIKFALWWVSWPHPWSTERPFTWGVEIAHLLLYPSVKRHSKFLIQKSSWIGSPANYNRDLFYSQSNRNLGHQILGREGVELNVTTD